MEAKPFEVKVIGGLARDQALREAALLAHGSHNQKSHGNWASGGEDGDYPDGTVPGDDEYDYKTGQYKEPSGKGRAEPGQSARTSALYTSPQKIAIENGGRGIEVEGEDYRHPLYPDVAINKDGRINRFTGKYNVFSNFKVVPGGVRLPDDDRVYPTVENAFQAAKQPVEARDPFVNVRPGGAFKAGGRVDLPKDWDTKKVAIVEELLRQKFNHGDYRDLLLGTGNDMIIEGPKYKSRSNTKWYIDPVWGDAPDGSGVGTNLLGKALMKIRDELRRG